jgi:hypothetical protein
LTLSLDNVPTGEKTVKGHITFDELQGKRVLDKEVFRGFVIKTVLMELDFPLLFVAGQKTGTDWLFNWCDTIEISNEQRTDRWLAFEISQERIEELKTGKFSLRDALMLPESYPPYYIFDSKKLFTPEAIKETLPQKIPSSYLPSDDLSINGELLRPIFLDKERMMMHFHLFAVQKGSNLLVPTITNFQDTFHRYMSNTAHGLVSRSSLKQIPTDPSKDWAAFKISPYMAGSFRMEWTSNDGIEQVTALSEACDVLEKMSKGKPYDFESLKSDAREQILTVAKSLSEFIAKSDVSFSLSWVSPKNPNGYLALDQRRASELLEGIEDVLSKKKPHSITLKLTPEEAEPILHKEIRGVGGMQSLLKRLKDNLNERTLTITIQEDDIEKVLRYGLNYGQGGFQGRLLGLAKALQAIKDSMQTRNYVMREKKEK